MIGLVALAALAIMASVTPAAASAEDRATARSSRFKDVIASTAPQRDRAEIAPASCPYHFTSDMPAATFCVYQGDAFGVDGEVCATDVVVIWSSLAADAEVADKAANSDNGVYLAFVADPQLVLRATADARQSNRAEMVGYTLGSDAVSQPLVGEITLQTKPPGSADVLNMDLHEPRRFDPESCPFTSYSGTFLGVIRPASESPRASAIEPRLVAELGPAEPVALPAARIDRDTGDRP